jgi:hypothetical protein
LFDGLNEGDDGAHGDVGGDFDAPFEVLVFERVPPDFPLAVVILGAAVRHKQAERAAFLARRGPFLEVGDVLRIVV